MHELAVCQDIITQVVDIANSHDAVAVHEIIMEIGPLSGVEADLLKAAFPIASAGTVAEHALLTINSMPIRIKCRFCLEESDATANNLACKKCGNWQTDLISGDEMILKRIELDT